MKLQKTYDEYCAIAHSEESIHILSRSEFRELVLIDDNFNEKWGGDFTSGMTKFDRIYYYWVGKIVKENEVAISFWKQFIPKTKEEFKERLLNDDEFNEKWNNGITIKLTRSERRSLYLDKAERLWGRATFQFDDENMDNSDIPKYKLKLV